MLEYLLLDEYISYDNSRDKSIDIREHTSLADLHNQFGIGTTELLDGCRGMSIQV